MVQKTYPLHNLLCREKFQEKQTPTQVMLSNYQAFLAEALVLPSIFFDYIVQNKHLQTKDKLEVA